MRASTTACTARSTRAGQNLVLVPHMYSGGVASMDRIIGPDRPLDPRRFCILVPGQLGNGAATSPSTSGVKPFPQLTVGDDVEIQRRLVAALAGEVSLHAIIGYSMGGHQAYGWATRYPERVPRLMIAAAAARPSSSAEALMGVLVRTLGVEPARRATALHARVWSVVGVTPEVYRRQAWRPAFHSQREFVETVFEQDFAALDPADLICQLDKWRRADFADALPQIRAATIVMPFRGDPFAPVEQCAAEQRTIPGAALRVLESVWGHYGFAGLGGSRDRDAIDAAIGDVLNADAYRPPPQ